MIDTVTGWFEITQYNDKRAQTQLKLRGCMDTLDQCKSHMTKDQNLLVISSENP